MLDVRWLEDLAAVAETKNLTRAAELRSVSQSGLSRRLQSLEHWAGAPLLDRRKSPVELTEAGLQLLATANDVIGRLNATRRALREDQDKATRSVRFYMDQTNRLNSAAGKALSISTCQSLTIGREKLVPLSAVDSDKQPIHDLAPEPRRSISYLGYSSECSLGWAVDQKLTEATDLPQLNRIYENSLADGLRSMALSGLGVAWLPLTTTHQDILRGRLVRTGLPELDVDLDVRIYRPQRRLSRRAEDLWSHLVTTRSVVELPELASTLTRETQTTRSAR